MDLMLEGQRHELMPGRMQLDPVDAVAEAVMCLKLGPYLFASLARS
jgi:hypothetical protein